MFIEYESGVFVKGDCLDVMKTIPDNYFDMILCDLPYGTTGCKWDSIIPFGELWGIYNRIIKDNGAIVLSANEPFTSKLICSNLDGFKYRWDWDKKIPSGMSYARFRPMQQSEDICIFTKNGEKTNYNPQMVKRDKPIKSGGVKHSESAPIANKDPDFKRTYDFKNPTTLIQFEKVRRGSIHPTQKPVELFEYLIKTYTNEGHRILDNCAGSGTTAIAAINTNRKWVCIEKDDVYFEKANERIKQHLESLCPPQKPA